MHKFIIVGLLAASLAGAGAQERARVVPDRAINCTDCGAWNQPHEPFRIFGNTHYVGTAGLSAVLITSDAGHILLDGALPQSAPLIDANIRKAGFRIEDLLLIVNSHAHYDHAGGLAALQRASGAVVAASVAGARALQQGHPTPDDPQYESGLKVPFTPVKNVKTVSDGEVLRVGPLELTAHLTPGHTPGATTWTWRSCEGSRCLNMVYADSLSPVSDDGFRFTADKSSPSIVDRFKQSLATLEQLPCDVLLAPHPGVVDLDGKLARMKNGRDAFVDSTACRAYAETIRKRLDARIAQELK